MGKRLDGRLRNGLLGVLVLSVAAGTAALLVVTTGADAATPASGTVSDASPSTTWAGGPFVVPNATGNVLDDPTCTLPTDCDDFTLTVNVPAGYDAGHQLKIEVSWPNAAADFDVYVYKAGTSERVASAATSANPETIIVAPAAGDLTVRVVPFAPLGDSYSATASLVATPSNPPPGTDPPPGFTNYAAPAAFADANSAGEPSIGNSFTTGATMYQAYLSTYKVMFDKATPAQATWTDVSADAASGCPQGSTQSLDPILFTDHATGRTFESQLTGVDSATCYTDDDGATWSPSTGGGIPSGVDHQSIGGGPFAAGGAGLPTSSYPHALYYCSQSIAAAFCAASLDGGTTFGAGVPTYNLTQCGGLHGHVKVGPDGTAYLPNKSCGANAAVAISGDSGSSWEVHNVPGSTPGDSDPSVGIGADGTVYFGYVGADGKPGVATSTDHGSTWRHLQTVGTEFGIQNAVFPTLVAGDGNRAAFAYIGTPTAGDGGAAGFPGVWHLYVSTTYDGGQSWVTSDATPTDPVQRGSICTAGTTCGANRNLLDFIDVTMDQQGRVLVGYADGCIDACVTDPTHTSDNGPADAQAAYATIARQSSGKTLLSVNDATVGGGGVTTNPGVSSTNVKLGRVRVVRLHGKFVATLTLKNTGTTTLSRVTVRIKDNGRRVGRKTVAVLAPGSRTRLKLRWTIVRDETSHVLVVVADPKHAIAESDEKDNKRKRHLRIT